MPLTHGVGGEATIGTVRSRLQVTAVARIPAEVISAMSQTLTVKLTDKTFAALDRQAAIAGTTPAAIAQKALEHEFGTNGDSSTMNQSEEARAAARARFERHFGSVDLGGIGADNERIDAELAAEYGDRHEDR